jgi:polyisoprenoid-binding protein YceI
VALREGTYQVGPQSGRLLVRTSRTGLGSRAGHDLTIEATRWEATVYVNPAEPGRSTVTVEVDVDSFEVREGSGGIKPLSASDRGDIKRTIGEKILHISEFPTIGFRSTEMAGSPESFAVDGELTIMGQSHPVTVRGSFSEEGRLLAAATVAQTRWGIKPYSAFLGALKLADDVAIEVDVTLGSAE